MTKIIIMKIIAIISFLLSISLIYADNIYGPYEYTRLNTEPIQWYPDEGIYNKTIYLSLTSEYGKIYYIINNNFYKEEPNEYTKELVLQGEEGSIVEYNIIALLEKEDNNIELYSRTYRIDKTNLYKKADYSKKEYLNKNVEYKKDRIEITYEFPNNNYGISYDKREFIFPQKIKTNPNEKVDIVLKGKDLEKSVYLVNCSYMKDDKIFTEIHSYTIDLAKPLPPSFGSLYWGQYYKQNYKLKIIAQNSNDTIYYWIREWDSEEYIVGPPLQSNIKSWEVYKSPIELIKKHGKESISGIAAFSMGKNGKYSEISGPYYFKIDGVNNTIEQIFENELKKEDTKVKKILLNNEELKNQLYKIKGKATLKFINFNSDDMFYFNFKSKNNEGKSELIPCNEEYTFVNENIVPVEIDLFLTNGSKIGSLEIDGENVFVPIMKNYAGNYIDLSSDTTIDFYMPEITVRYESTSNVNKYLEITKDSEEFLGSLKLSAKKGEEISLKIKFGLFDENNNLIKESEEFYFKIDKKDPQNEVIAGGIDFDIVHNERQILTLIPPEKNGKIFYKFYKENEWILYDTPISFFPPSLGNFSIKVYTKFIDESGNEIINNNPFEILFDTRAIFVDENKEFSGNGTEKNPYGSLPEAIRAANFRNIKLIYILSDVINVSNPMKIDSDIIIQYYNIRPKIIMDSKSIWRKNHVWFDVAKNGFFELRNIDFLIKSGGFFSKLSNSKMKIYNLRFIYSSEDDFTFIDYTDSMLGISSIYFEATNYPKNFVFCNLVKSKTIINNLLLSGKYINFNMLDINMSEYFIMQEASVDLKIDGNSKFAVLNKSNVIIDIILYKQTGAYKKTLLYDLNESNLYMGKNDFILEGFKPFEINFLVGKNSKIDIMESLFWAIKGSSIIGFNLNNSEISINRTQITTEDIIDYVCNIRCKNSIIKLNSSIIGNFNYLNAISFMLENSNFEGVNNSIFNINATGRGFNFWINDKADITTVNSIYLFDKNSQNNSFIYLNNINYDEIKPKWFSNVISSDIILLENLDKKDTDFIVKDFTEKNIFYSFNNEFNINSYEFFIPIANSPILQGGLPEYSSPLHIPEKDFFGRNRIIPGFGIDIGAVQKSGNF